jgi:hypothetical protein
MATPFQLNELDDLRELAGKLTSYTRGDTWRRPGLTEPAITNADVIVSHVEVTDRHGVGKLLRMMFFDEPNIITIRSLNRYEGQNELGDANILISHASKSREAVFATVLNRMGDHTVRRVLCVPYYPDDVRTAIAIKEIYGVPLCTYMMDDQNVCIDGIPDDLMRELFSKSRLILGISSEMCTIYAQKYGCNIWPMPPLAPGRLIPSRLIVPDQEPSMKGVIIGNIYGQEWIQMLRCTVRGSGVSLSWYCNGEFRWLPCSREDLVEDLITPCDPLQEDVLVSMLRREWFAVLPSGFLAQGDDAHFLAQLSLPSRLTYMMATSHIPILVLGSENTAAARFVRQFDIGTVVPYEKERFIDAVKHLVKRDVNLAMRRRALAAAARFTDVGAAEWIWASLAGGGPIDQRFADVLPERAPELGLRSARVNASH